MNPPLTMFRQSPFHRFRAALIWLGVTMPVAGGLLWGLAKVGFGRWDALVLCGLALGIAGGFTKLCSP